MLLRRNLISTVFLTGAIPFAISCTDESSPSEPTTPECPILGYPCTYDASSTYVVYGDGYVIKAGQTYNQTSTVDKDVIVYPELNFAADAYGNLVGGTNSDCSAILDATTQEPVIQRVNVAELTPVSPAAAAPETEQPGNNAPAQYKLAYDFAWVLEGDQTYLIYGNAEVSDNNCNIVGTITDFYGGDIIGTNGNVIFKGVDASGLPAVMQEDNAKCSTVNKPAQPSQNQNQNQSQGSTTQTQSSATQSTQKSSSSAAKPAPSTSASTGGQCPNIVTKGGGGSGWATRYWDCCKPSCSWNENAWGNPAKQCDAKGKNQNNDYGAQSVCSGGNAATCTSQIPFTIDGCKEMAFAFAAVPASNGGQCGKCFQLTFTGEGKYSNDANIRAIKGKKLIVMVTNIGSDVNQGQFDIMIPGGGVGQFNGCSQMGWGDQGEQYGGLLSVCETETGYSAGGYVNCLEKKCNSVFANDEQAKEGCLFLAGWMHAASNPMHNYVEVECPSVLKSKY